MTRPLVVLAALALLAVGARLMRRRRPVEQQPDDYDEPVPMAAWDGTARYDENSHTVRIRWMPTTTEVAR